MSGLVTNGEGINQFMTFYDKGEGVGFGPLFCMMKMDISHKGGRGVDKFNRLYDRGDVGESGPYNCLRHYI